MNAVAQFRWFVTRGCLAGLSLVSFPAHAVPVGSEFRVNTYTPGTQGYATLSVGGDGEVLASWIDVGRGSSVYTQRYDQAGNPSPQGQQLLGQGVAAALDGAGNYVVLRGAFDGSGGGVYASVYDRLGNIRVNEFRVNDTTAGDQQANGFAVNAQGEFVVAWTSTVGGMPSVYLKRFHANGVPVAREALASNPAAGPQRVMGVAIDARGNSVVTWYSQVQQSLELDVWLRRFNALGVAQGAPVRANTFTLGPQVGNRVAMSSTGEFIVVWESYHQASVSWDIYAQRYTAAGVRVGGEFLVNTLLVGEQQIADVALADDGSFVVAWQTDNRWDDPSSLPTVYARQYRADGTPIEIEQAVSSSPTGRAFQPHIALDRAGNYLIAWHQYDVVTGDMDVYARRYVQDTLPSVAVLTNGQASGPVSGTTGSFTYYRFDVPQGATSLQIDLTGFGTGDADLYVRFAGLPLLNAWDVRPYLVGSNESVVINNILAGEWFIGINAFEGFSNVSLTATFR